MANQTVAASSAILQQVYAPGVADWLNSSTILSDRLKRKTRGFQGNQLVIAAHSARSFAHPTTDAQNLPARATETYKSLTFNIVKTGARMGITRETMARTKNAPKGAHVDLLRAGMDGIKDACKQNFNRQLFGNGNGGLALVGTSVAAGTTVSVDSTRFLVPGAPVVLASVNGTDARAGADNTISTVDSGTQVTLASAVTATASVDYFYFRLDTSTPVRAVDMWGIVNVTDTSNPVGGMSNFGGLSKSTNSSWQGNVLHNSGTNRPLTTTLMKQGMNLTSRRGGTVTLGITNDAAHLEYGSLLVADRRFGPSAMVTLDGGFKALDFSGVPIVEDKDAPANQLFLLDESSLFIAELEDWQFEDSAGSILNWIDNTHAFEAYYFCMKNLVADRCNNQTRIQDIRESFQTYNQ